jgi:hypothetical protein
MSPTSKLGAAVAMSIKPTLKAESVTRNIKIDAAKDVSEYPMVETNCPVHKNVKLRLRKTAKGDDERTAIVVILMPSLS